MSRAALVVMAAGLGSRFGGGIKQLEPVGPNREIIMEYSIYDAVEAGFDKVVFVIRRDIETDFREAVGKKIEQIVDVAYVYQEVEDIPPVHRERFTGRTKPWGTGQAILCCRNAVDSPFLVINADDFYGKQAYKEAYGYLTHNSEHSEQYPQRKWSRHPRIVSGRSGRHAGEGRRDKEDRKNGRRCRCTQRRRGQDSGCRLPGFYEYVGDAARILLHFGIRIFRVPGQAGGRGAKSRISASHNYWGTAGGRQGDCKGAAVFGSVVWSDV